MSIKVTTFTDSKKLYYTEDNPLAKTCGVSPRTGGRTMYNYELISLCANFNLKSKCFRLKATFEGLFLHSIEINQFVDSPEYDSVSQFDLEEKFQVNIRIAILDILSLVRNSYPMFSYSGWHVLPEASSTMRAFACACWYLSLFVMCRV